MASSVTQPLERQFGEIPGVAQMTSSSTLGHRAITVQFDLDRNIDGAAQDVPDRDQRRQRPAADESALAADLPEGQSGRSADPGPRPSPPTPCR